VVLKSAGCEHETRIGGFGARTLTIRFSPQSALGRAVPENTWLWSEHTEIVRRALVFQRAFGSGAVADLERIAVDLVATMSAIANRTAPVPPWISTIRASLEQNFQSAIRFDALARDVGLHPTYVSRAFRSHVGVSMTNYVRTLRVRHARHLLVSSRRSIAAIAADAGFADPSHLSRTFADLLHVTPTEYRRLYAPGSMRSILRFRDA
jgi:AraC family transcriptional regulator